MFANHDDDFGPISLDGEAGVIWREPARLTAPNAVAGL
jgi:hypothetical protein